MKSPFFNIAQVQVVGTDQVDPEEITNLIGVLPGQNIFSLRAKDVIDALAGHPWIQGVELIRQLPDKVVLQVTERQSVFVVPHGTFFLEVAADGVVLAVRPLAKLALPLVTGVDVPEQVRLGQRLLGEEVTQVGRCLLGMPLGFVNQVAEIHLDEHKDIIFYTTDGVQVLVGEPVNLPQKLALLSATWDELGAEGQIPASIDVRSCKEAIVRLK